MNYKKVILSALVISTVSLSALPTGVFAQKATTALAKTERKKAHCTRVTTRVNDLTTRLTGDEPKRQSHYQKVIDRLNTIIAKVEAANINADKLKSDVASLTSKKTAWQAEYTTLLSKLNATKKFACGQSEGQFVQAVKDARAQRQTMHNTNMDFWNFVKNTVKPDIQSIRGQLKSTLNQ